MIVLLLYYSVIGWKHGKLYQKKFISKMKISNMENFNIYTRK
jgi:hypothetical protein